MWPGFVVLVRLSSGVGPGVLAGAGEGVDEGEDGALVGGGEVLDLLEPAEEAGGPGRRGVARRREAEEFVSRDAWSGRTLTTGNPACARKCAKVNP